MKTTIIKQSGMFAQTPFIYLDCNKYPRYKYTNNNVK